MCDFSNKQLELYGLCQALAGAGRIRGPLSYADYVPPTASACSTSGGACLRTIARKTCSIVVCESENAAMLRALSGNTHEVHTAVAAAYGDSIETVTCTTSVLFTELSEPAIQQYLLTDEPWDKAGAYAIQGYAGAFVTQIKGSYSAVVGLPLCETRALLIEAGVPVRHG